MNHLSWNCRGLGNSRTVHVSGDLIKDRKPDFLFLSETLVMNNKLKELSVKFGFKNYFAVDRVGRGGGLAVMWKPNVACKVDNYSQNHINVIMLNNSIPYWRLTCYYGFPEMSKRRDAWNFIRRLATGSSLPWCIVGDFNDMLYASDKAGKNKHPQYLMDGFQSAVNDANLIELPLSGGKYTWEKGKVKQNWVRS